MQLVDSWECADHKRDASDFNTLGLSEIQRIRGVLNIICTKASSDILTKGHGPRKAIGAGQMTVVLISDAR